MIRVSQHSNVSVDVADIVEDERDNILKWLSPLPYHSYHTSVSEKVLEGTGRWLLEDSRYAKWKASNGTSILWLHGSLGSGKSCLTYVCGRL